MNTLTTLAIVKTNGVKTLKADKTNKSSEIDQLLVELGNSTTAIPFYAIYPANGSDPITLKGPITPWQIFRALQKAGPSNPIQATATEVDVNHSIR